MEGTYYLRHQGCPATSEVKQGALGICNICQETVTEKDPVLLIPLGPGNDREEQEKAASGQWYNAICCLAHKVCVTGEDAA